MWNWHFSDWLCDTSSFDNINYKVCLETHISCIQNFSGNEKHAICIMFPSNKRVTMETNFQNSKNWPFFLNLNIFFLQQSCI